MDITAHMTPTDRRVYLAGKLTATLLAAGYEFHAADNTQDLTWFEMSDPVAPDTVLHIEVS